MQRPRATRLLSALVAAGLAVAASGVVAGVEDDYRDATAAFRRGDMNTAVKTLQRGSDAGHVPSMLLLGYVFEQASLDSQAVAVYRKAAAAGSADGDVGLAGMVAAGKGTPRDVSEALRLYESAAARGNATAINVLAQAYIGGTLGLTPAARDDAKALAAIRRAAEQGYGPASEALARAYTRGDFGLTPDPSEAARWQSKKATDTAPSATVQVQR